MRSTVPTIKCEDAPSPSGGAGAEDPGGAYNLSVNLSAAVIGLLTAESANTTLRTPEIVNDVITMTNPLDQYNYNEKTSGFKVTCQFLCKYANNNRRFYSRLHCGKAIKMQWAPNACMPVQMQNKCYKCLEPVPSARCHVTGHVTAITPPL